MNRIGVAIALSTLWVTAAFATPQKSVVAPKLVGTTWLNTKDRPVESIKEFKGHVTILHFWTFECINCKHNLPSIAAWAKKYPVDQVQVIGVHTPELKEERNQKNLQEAITRLGIEYPVIVDNNGENWNRYKVEVWPTVFIIDKKGQVRAYWVGELGWKGATGFQDLSKIVQTLIKEPG